MEEMKSVVAEKNEMQAMHLNHSEGKDTTRLFFYEPDYTYGFFISPIVYEPVSQTVSVLESYFQNAEAGGLEGQLLAYVTQDLGDNWNLRELSPKNPTMLPLRASFTVLNTTGSTDPAELEYVTGFGGFVLNETDNTYYFQNGLMVNFTFPMSTGRTSEYFTTVYPSKNNNTKGFMFSHPRMVGETREDGAYAYMVGRAEPVNTNDYRYGPAFFASINFEDEDFDANLMLTNTFDPPLTYWGDNASVGVSKNMMDVDGEGNVYVGTINYLRPDHPEEGEGEGTWRSIAFMKSSDNGNTWSDWIAYPKDKIKKFVEEHGQNKELEYVPIIGTTWFHKFGFVSTGNDEVSFIFPLLTLEESVTNPDGSTTEEFSLYLTELRYENGTWNDPVIIDEELPVRSSYSQWAVENAGTRADPRDTLTYNSFRSEGMEIEAARVVGTKDLVVKFVQYTNDLIGFETPVLVNPANEPIDTILNRGVYGAAKVNGSWKKIIPIADDPMRCENNSHLPTRVPSVERVPMLYALTPTPASEENIRYNYPPALRDLVWSWYKSAIFGTYNFLTVDVEDNSDAVKAAVEMDIFPNPANNEVNISFTTGNENVRMEIFNALGSKVMTVLPEQIKEPGTKVAPVNVSELPVGTYYVTLTVGNETFTKALNVVR
jgi:hypothetical protein